MSRNGRVVVTGASGLVGSGVLPQLKLAGYEVIGLARVEKSDRRGASAWIHQDLASDFEAALDRFLPIAAVIHLAAAIDPSVGLGTLRTVNMEASERLFDYCGRRGVAKVVYVSSLGLMARPLQNPIREIDPIGALYPYHVSKYWAELALRAAAVRHSFAGVILRISSPVPASFSLLPRNVLHTWLKRAKAGLPLGLWGTGSRTQNFVAAEDVGQAVVQALRHCRSFDLLHIAAGRQTSMRELADAIGDLAGVPIEVTNPVDPNEDDRWNIDISHARELIGYVPRFQVADYLPALYQGAPCAAP